MSNITNELQRISQAKSDIKNSIENKGVEVSENALIDSYYEYIDEISTGGTVDGGWKRPDWWVDLVDIVDSDLGMLENPIGWGVNLETPAGNVVDFSINSSEFGYLVLHDGYNGTLTSVVFNDDTNVDDIIVIGDETYIKISNAEVSGSSGSLTFSKSQEGFTLSATYNGMYPYKYGFMLYDGYPTIGLTTNATDRVVYKLSDGSMYGTDIVHTWDTSKDVIVEGRLEKQRWGIVYSDVELVNVQLPAGVVFFYGGNCLFSASGWKNNGTIVSIKAEFNPAMTDITSMFEEDKVLKEVESNTTFNNVTSATKMFSGCYLIKKLPKNMTLKNATVIDNLFMYCYNLEYLPEDLTFERTTNSTKVFYHCTSLKKLPDNMKFDLGVKNANDMFVQCRALEWLPDDLNLSGPFSHGPYLSSSFNLKNLPRNSTFSGGVFWYGNMGNLHNLMYLPEKWLGTNNISFSGSPLIIRDHVATFDETTGDLNGGITYWMVEVPQATTLTFHSAIKNKFTEDEQLKIAAHLSNLGWTLSW